ncbi:MAG: 4-(cytidine 5'-diphospho)-2-C-methyl-D-erythritol kinase [Rudaea sp.]|uniref:4-(cytidine 5'-diphospho)-2-C-methyl-D-erythritol kinase n=1 Tax=Rudaea sp. TaxID=2136325 RepID=UPI0039E2D3A7
MTAAGEDGWSAWPAPAKLNLFLHIVGRRADGYHLLQTVFQLLDWGDTLRLRVRNDARIVRVNGAPGVAVEQDLCVRAARALAECAEAEFGVDIALEKRVPIGGGLGGGSSDAATVLVALNELWETGLTGDELADLGLRLGADVPVFVRGHSAWAEGVGEKLAPIALPPREYVILDPHVTVPTAGLFQAAELTRNSPPATIESYLSGIGTNNAFAPVARARYPRVAAALDWLGRHGDARLSGSGGCVFLATDSRDEADEIAHACPPEFSAYVASGVNRSPLLDAVDAHRMAENGKDKP